MNVGSMFNIWAAYKKKVLEVRASRVDKGREETSF
jgi:hypothetical protein